ncbi:CD2 antigen cytoplasmic tail-binding protein 2 [Orchesella cincta]|uniref:CD2 antigen cytoplasmic tail-binding protein 2 n=1 Tax=Orchesella cincta TaxID=48709 RepID=A0A1D2MD89_ORCCI|nr:CD2 antigen cytoplasmic tail-binding protein 2 [Orchesella cincta]
MQESIDTQVQVVLVEGVGGGCFYFGVNMEGKRKLSRKRKLLEGEDRDDYSGGIEEEMSKFGQHSSSLRKHTMDSDEDEEDDEDYNKRKHNVLDEEEIEGQEEGTLEFDGETRITPFNMKDELEEGYFDGNGMYIWNKRDGEIKDSWLDSVDWMKVKQKDSSTSKPPTSAATDDMDTDSKGDNEPVDVLSLYKQMLQLLQPGESVLKAIKRIGVELTASERLKQKKQAAKLAAKNGGGAEAESSSTSAAAAPPEEKEPNEAAEKITKLTGLADSILSATGNMNIYQETFESVAFKIKREETKKLSSAVGDDDDMFGDGFEAKNDDALPASTASSVGGGGDAASSSISDPSDEVKWEFKWEDKEDAPIYGPHTSTEMQAWVTEGYFKEGVFVRKFKQDGKFYTSKRVDFELYC